MRFPSSSSPVKCDSTILWATGPGPTSAFLHRLLRRRRRFVNSHFCSAAGFRHRQVQPALRLTLNPRPLHLHLHLRFIFHRKKLPRQHVISTHVIFNLNGAIALQYGEIESWKRMVGPFRTVMDGGAVGIFVSGDGGVDDGGGSSGVGCSSRIFIFEEKGVVVGVSLIAIWVHRNCRYIQIQHLSFTNTHRLLFSAKISTTDTEREREKIVYRYFLPQKTHNRMMMIYIERKREYRELENATRKVGFYI